MTTAFDYVKAILVASGLNDREAGERAAASWNRNRKIGQPPATAEGIAPADGAVVPRLDRRGPSQQHG